MFEQEQASYEEPRINRQVEIESSLISIPTKALTAYPGEQVFFSIQVNGPPNHVVELLLKEPSRNIATAYVNPRKSQAPFAAIATIIVNPGAPPGLYTLTIRLYDTEKSFQLAKEKVSLIVLRKGVPKTLANHYNRLIVIFNKYGSNGLVWYILKHIYPEGASFTRIKSIYEQIVGKDISKGTIGNILQRMIKKGIIRRDDGQYKLLVTKPEVLVTRIDTSRIRLANKRASRKETKQKPSQLAPRQISIAFQRALKIKKRHGLLPAICFLAHTLVGARETGFLLLWLNEWFLYCEQKTGFCHHFYSQLLDWYFRTLGAKQGIMYSLTENYMRAQRIASKYIRKYYKTHSLARRLHYMLKQYKLIKNEKNEIFVIEILYYDDNTVGIRIWDNNREELLYSENVREEPPRKTEYYTAFPEEHVYKPNDNTYFIRPRGFYGL